MAISELNSKLLITSRCAQTISTQRIHLARFAREKGWDVYLAGEQNSDVAVQSLRGEKFSFDAIRVEQGSLNPISVVRLFVDYCCLIKTHRPSVFHAFTIKPIIAGLLAATFCGVPVRVATVAGLGHIFLSSSTFVRFMAFMLFRISFLGAHMVYFYNEADREEFIQKRIVPRSKAMLIAGSGIDTARFPARKLPNRATLSIAFVGRLLREKGVPELLAAMRLLRRDRVPVTLHLIGDTDQNNPSAIPITEIEKAVAEGLIVWHGHVSNVSELLAPADIVILPSHREGIPMSLLEGGAMGRALIATKVPGCRDVVRHGATGLLVPPNDSQAIADAIVLLANDRNLLEKMGRAARADVVARFDTAVVNDLVLQGYEERAVLVRSNTR
jgi:glycosyltransferase involved in cell wall biosynthesis